MEWRAPKTLTLEKKHLHVYSGEDSSLIATPPLLRNEEGDEKNK